MKYYIIIGIIFFIIILLSSFKKKPPKEQYKSKEYLFSKQERDTFVNQALQQAGIPIMHTRSSNQIKKQIEEKIKLPE